jgi:hypothetical protein
VPRGGIASRMHWVSARARARAAAHISLVILLLLLGVVLPRCCHAVDASARHGGVRPGVCCLHCSAGVEGGQGSCYQYFTGTLTWQASQNDCVAKGAHLLTTLQQSYNVGGVLDEARRRWPSARFWVGSYRGEPPFPRPCASVILLDSVLMRYGGNSRRRSRCGVRRHAAPA